MKDVEVIEELKEIVAKRKHAPSRKLCNEAETILKEKYKVTNKEVDELLKKIIKLVGAVTLTCSVRFKVKLDIIQFSLEE